MPLTHDQQIRIENLRADFVSGEQMRDLIGVFPRDQYTYGRFRQYATLLSKRKIAEKDSLFSRFVFEGFLQHYRLLPRRSGALQLGMTSESLGQTIEALTLKGWIDINDLTMPSDLIDESFIRSIYTLFPSMQGVLFTDHTDFCRQLHEAIRNEFKITVDTVYCTTSQARGDNPVEIANSICVVSHQPSSIRNEIMMDFGKPISLPPDTCSRILIEQNLNDLKPFVLGQI
jgi:hypothetical protein